MVKFPQQEIRVSSPAASRRCPHNEILLVLTEMQFRLVDDSTDSRRDRGGTDYQHRCREKNLPGPVSPMASGAHAARHRPLWLPCPAAPRRTCTMARSSEHPSSGTPQHGPPLRQNHSRFNFQTVSQFITTAASASTRPHLVSHPPVSQMHRTLAERRERKAAISCRHGLPDSGFHCRDLRIIQLGEGAAFDCRKPSFVLHAQPHEQHCIPVRHVHDRANRQERPVEDRDEAEFVLEILANGFGVPVVSCQWMASKNGRERFSRTES